MTKTHGVTGPASRFFCVYNENSSQSWHLLAASHNHHSSLWLWWQCTDDTWQQYMGWDYLKLICFENRKCKYGILEITSGESHWCSIAQMLKCSNAHWKQDRRTFVWEPTALNCQSENGAIVAQLFHPFRVTVYCFYCFLYLLFTVFTVYCFYCLLGI